MNFSDGHSSHATCTPSRFALLTGQYSFRQQGTGIARGNANLIIKPGPNEIGFDYHFIIPATGDRTLCVYVEQGKVIDHDPTDPIEVNYDERIDHSPSGAEARDTLKLDWSNGHNQTIVNGISRIGWMAGGAKARWVDEDMAGLEIPQGFPQQPGRAARPAREGSNRTPAPRS